MIVRPRFAPPAATSAPRAGSRRLAWSAGALLALSAAATFAVSDGSAAVSAVAVRTALLAALPLAFLASLPLRRAEPNARFPYGSRRHASITVLFTALALATAGAWIAAAAARGLLAGDRASLGVVGLPGSTLWAGWAMLAVLGSGALPPWWLGRRQRDLARVLHDKVLYASADACLEHWKSLLAATAAIVLVGGGVWQADGVGALIVGSALLADGGRHLAGGVSDLLDQRPTDVAGGRPDRIADDVRARLLGLPFVVRADVRLRQEGDLVAGEAWIVPVDERDLLARIDAAEAAARSVSWRVHEVVVRPMRDLQPGAPAAR